MANPSARMMKLMVRAYLLFIICMTFWMKSGI